MCLSPWIFFNTLRYTGTCTKADLKVEYSMKEKTVKWNWQKHRTTPDSPGYEQFYFVNPTDYCFLKRLRKWIFLGIAIFLWNVTFFLNSMVTYLFQIYEAQLFCLHKWWVTTSDKLTTNDGTPVKKKKKQPMTEPTHCEVFSSKC